MLFFGSWVLTDKSTAEDIEKNERKVKARLVCGVWPKTSLLCGTQVTRVRMDGGVV